MTSHVSNAFFALVVLSNSMYLGVQLEYHAVVKDSSADAIFLYIHLVYAVLFTIEVGLRLLADGFFTYFCSAEWAWNILDVFIVSSSWIELIIDVLTPGDPETPNRGTNTNLRLIRLLRVGRLFRVVRIIRVVRLFRSLRTLVQSLVGTLKTLFWALLLLFLIMHLASHKDMFPLSFRSIIVKTFKTSVPIAARLHYILISKCIYIYIYMLCPVLHNLSCCARMKLHSIFWTKKTGTSLVYSSRMLSLITSFWQMLPGSPQKSAAKLSNTSGLCLHPSPLSSAPFLMA